MHGPTCIFWANLTPFSLQEAIEAPRVSLPYETDGVDSPAALTVNIEGRIGEEVVEALRGRGHLVNMKAHWDPFFGPPVRALLGGDRSRRPRCAIDVASPFHLRMRHR